MFVKAREVAKKNAEEQFNLLDVNGDGDFEQTELRVFAFKTWFNAATMEEDVI